MTSFFIGDVALDEYYTADRWPGRADKGMVKELPAEAGGSIANAAVVHAGLGGETQFISLLNDSPLSQRLIADLKDNGVGVDHMLIDPAIPESRNFIFLVDGEHVVLTVEMGEQPMWLDPAALDALRQPGFLYTTLYRVRRLHARTEQGVVKQAVLLADLRQHGRRAIFDLDVGGCTPQDMPYLTGAAVVIFNQVGFRAAFGHDDITMIGDWMQAHAIDWVVRTLAADGAEARNGDTVLRVPGFPVEVVDVTGAGDTFGGTLTWCLSQGQTIEEALDFSVAAASRSVTIHGPRAGKATPQDIRRWHDNERRQRAR
ncbi:carbohydrate kinase family protein [Ensifer adhaerens]|uniref:carbohydrate kinase family protein n=1 Tax=Ensifer adhaerens TaxID=106592 RepID=UPI001CBAFA8F|nr:carbohydrate kinase family protein [Ensifer adhaerens]MBZ7925614.1 carbohydrate kinase family protein [Ensifer adhaerens]UAX95236.1 carbohydrate kinase family protein [Ensifer adhaerens]UAY02872.1 carbohydrate kinase family protein [Ensifer adhaerens]UAY10856.1 carbohydrate kinase family protein [Ensifer adhaerens]